MFEQEKTAVLVPPVGAGGDEPLSKITDQSIAETNHESNPTEKDFNELMHRM